MASLSGFSTRRPVLALFLALTFVVVAALGERIPQLSARRIISYDESISYLAATCHEGAYAEVEQPGGPYGRWVPAREWRRFLEVEQTGCFTTIQQDLAETDIHPPFYFWLLHAMVVLRGVSPTTGTELNLLFQVVGASLLFLLGRAQTGSNLAGIAIALLWSYSRGALAASVMARQYELLAVLGIAAGSVVATLVKGGGRPALPLALGGVLYLAAMTHYQGIFLYAACAVALAAGVVRGAPPVRRLCAYGLGACVAAAVLVVVSQPGLAEQVHRAGAQRQPFEPSAIAARIQAIARALTGAVPWPLSDSHPAGALVVLVIGLSWPFVMFRRVREDWRGGNVASLVPFIFVAVSAGAIFAQYLAFMSPKHAMGPRYLALFLPWFAFAPVQVLQAVRGPMVRQLLTAALILAVVAGGIVDQPRRTSRGPWRLKGHEAVVIDEAKRGVLPAIVYHLDDDQEVLVASPKLLLSRPDLWERALGHHPEVLLLSTQASSRQSKVLLAHLEKRYEVVPAPRTYGDSVLIRERPPAPEVETKSDASVSPPR